MVRYFFFSVAACCLLAAAFTYRKPPRTPDEVHKQLLAKAEAQYVQETKQLLESNAPAREIAQDLLSKQAEKQQREEAVKNPLSFICSSPEELTQKNGVKEITIPAA